MGSAGEDSPAGGEGWGCGEHVRHFSLYWSFPFWLTLLPIFQGASIPNFPTPNEHVKHDVDTRMSGRQQEQYQVTIGIFA